MPRDAQAARLSRPPPCDEEEADAAREVPRRDEFGGAMGTIADVDRAALPEGRTEGWTSTHAAGEDASSVFPAAMVCAE